MFLFPPTTEILYLATLLEMNLKSTISISTIDNTSENTKKTTNIRQLRFNVSDHDSCKNGVFIMYNIKVRP